MPWRRFLAFNAAGGIVWATLYGTAAYLLGKEVERLSRPVAIGFGIAGAIAIITVAVVIRRQEQRLEAAAEQALPGPLEGYPGGRPL
jgi:membrane protein DedA with SNARE-associated domain